MINILLFLLMGIVAGFIARAVVPGNDAMGLVGTLVLGVVGSVVGGFLGFVIFGKDLSEGAFQPAGLIGSIIGAVIALVVYKAATSRGRVA